MSQNKRAFINSLIEKMMIVDGPRTKRAVKGGWLVDDCVAMVRSAETKSCVEDLNSFSPSSQQAKT